VINEKGQKVLEEFRKFQKGTKEDGSSLKDLVEEGRH